MGYISYPRTGGSAKDIKRAEHVLSLIERLLQHFNPSDLRLLLTLVSRIGWRNLPPALRARLLQLLYYDLFEKIKAQSKKEVGAAINVVQPATKMLVDVALQQQALFETISLADLSLHERINKTAHVSVSRKVSTQVSGYEQEMLVFDNGIHVFLTADASRQRYLSHQHTLLRVAGRVYDVDTVQMLKQAHKSGMLTTVNLLSDFIIDDNTQSNNDNSQAIRPVRYDLQKIQRGMLVHTGVRNAVLDAIECNLEIGYQKSTTSALGYKPTYRLLQSFLMDRVNKTYSVASNKVSSFNFWVEDSLTRGTECRLLTVQMINIARQFEAQGRKATLLEWLGQIEAALVYFFKMVRIKRQSNHPPRHHNLHEAELKAAAIRQQLQQYLNHLNIPMDLTLSNQLARQGISAELPDLDSTEDMYVEF